MAPAVLKRGEGGVLHIMLPLKISLRLRRAVYFYGVKIAIDAGAGCS